MLAFLLSVILSFQGPSVTNRPSAAAMGTITGVLKSSSGKPAAGVRITAVSRSDDPADAGQVASMASLAETDENGAFRLEGIPPGSYYVAAGRVDLPTYFPGTLDMAKGKTVDVTPAAVVAHIDFIMDDASVRSHLPTVDTTTTFNIFDNFTNRVAALTLPVQVRMEGDTRQPVLANNRPVMIRITKVSDNAISEVFLNDSSLNFPMPGSLPGTEFRITVENLPQGFIVKSMIQDGVDFMHNTLKITGKNFRQATGSETGQPGMLLNIAAPMTPLEITLAAITPLDKADSGVRVKGRASSRGPWFPYLSGVPGILFADGTFEFRNVTPGRHIILLQDRPDTPFRLLAASVVVGDKDLNDVETDDTLILPSEIKFPARTPPPGSIPLAWIHGRVTDDISKEPVFGGTVTLAGKNKTDFAIDSEGMFEIPRLLPGTYDLTIAGSDHAPVHQSIVVGDEDIPLQVTAHAKK